MNFQFQVTAPVPTHSEVPVALPASHDTTELLRQIVAIQSEQLALLRQMSAAQDSAGRWKSLLSRWRDDYGNLAAACKQALPQLERAYVALMAELTEALRQQEDRPLDNEFALNEFLDRYGMRLSQLVGILSLVGPLADQAPATEESK